MISGKFHWLAQRLSALILLPLLTWFIFNFLRLKNFEYLDIIIFFNSKINFLLFYLMIILMIYHSYLGIKTIVEDYISNILIRNRIIIFTKFFSYGLMIICLLSIILLQCCCNRSRRIWFKICNWPCRKGSKYSLYYQSISYKKSYCSSSRRN